MTLPIPPRESESTVTEASDAKVFYEKNFYFIDTLYAITFNPEWQFNQKPDRYDKFHTKIYNLLVDLKISYDVVIEVSEPHARPKREYMQYGSEGPRLHIHGVIRFDTRKQLQDFLLFGVYRLCQNGITKIDSVKDLQIWSNYCKKQHILPKNRRIYSRELLLPATSNKPPDVVSATSPPPLKGEGGETPKQCIDICDIALPKAKTQKKRTYKKRYKKKI